MYSMAAGTYSTPDPNLKETINITGTSTMLDLTTAESTDMTDTPSMVKLTQTDSKPLSTATQPTTITSNSLTENGTSSPSKTQTYHRTLSSIALELSTATLRQNTTASTVQNYETTSATKTNSVTSTGIAEVGSSKTQSSRLTPPTSNATDTSPNISVDNIELNSDDVGRNNHVLVKVSGTEEKESDLFSRVFSAEVREEFTKPGGTWCGVK